MSSSHLVPYGFTFVVLVVGLTLSREYSDAFTRIEDQVAQRTTQLNQALFNVKEVQKLKDEQAKRFAHDIRSPLAALQVLKDVISRHLSDDEKSLLKHTIIRINDLSNTSLPKLLGETDQSSDRQSSVFLWPIIDKLVSEKRVEFKHIQDFEIDVVKKGDVFDLCSNCNETELARIFSNLINNSIEARTEDKKLSIIILLQKIHPYIQISIQDNGKGMPQQIQSKVLADGFSYGKKDGKGIGLSSAKKIIESWSGKMQLHSTENIGTTITITIPLSNPPDWLVTKLDLSTIEHLVIIDDQPYVVDTWKQRLLSFQKKFQIHWIQNMEDWEKITYLPKETTMFLVDFDLSSNVTGIDLISKLRLFPNICLVTGNEDDIKLREKAISMNIPILPKSLIHTVNIRV